MSLHESNNEKNLRARLIVNQLAYEYGVGLGPVERTNIAYTCLVLALLKGNAIEDEVKLWFDTYLDIAL